MFPKTQTQQLPESQSIAVVMVPLPAQGHLNPLLHLSAHLASPLIHIHYVSSSPHNLQARQRLQGWNLSLLPIHFHDLIPFPSLPSPPPNPLSPHKFPSHLQPSFDSSSSHLLPHLSSLLLSLSPRYRRLLLLHDSSMSFASSASPSTESFSFHAASAISNLFFLGKLPPHLCQANLTSCFTPDFLHWFSSHRRRSPKGHLFNTCRAIEGGFLDQLSDHPGWIGQRMFAVGPLNPIRGDWGGGGGGCIQWLDRQGEASVLYVSFGTTASLSKEQRREIAAGLEASGQSFVWVRREADRCNVFEAGEEGADDLDLVEWEER